MPGGVARRQIAGYGGITPRTPSRPGSAHEHKRPARTPFELSSLLLTSSHSS
ncbi:hypothetical protein AURDEDRAFT_113047 [Auricularia subglabra TFB-10046 SS5]|nr:hypothetical protein AURDEDRAFT_113047 [Auricularia subglabra TFB-10046 SS5]